LGEPPSARTYISPDRSFELRLPAGFGVETGKQKPSRSYIPVCHDESLVCITFPPGRYTGTNFGDASLEVTLLPAKTAQACLSALPDASFQIAAKNPSRAIDGARFLHALIGGAAMSHEITGDQYRNFKNGKCYRLSLQITFTNFQVYDPGTIE